MALWSHSGFEVHAIKSGVRAGPFGAFKFCLLMQRLKGGIFVSLTLAALAPPVWVCSVM
jgi:hypothetical protein